MESVNSSSQNVYQGMWKEGYNVLLKLLITHVYNIDVYTADLDLQFQLLTNGFNSQLVDAVTKSTDNRN